jgi:hypothetical protein
MRPTSLAQFLTHLAHFAPLQHHFRHSNTATAVMTRCHTKIPRHAFIFLIQFNSIQFDIERLRIGVFQGHKLPRVAAGKMIKQHWTTILLTWAR